MGNYSAYAEYKDSSIEWLGKIPAHWNTYRIKHIAKIFGRIGFRGYTLADIVSENEGAIALSPSNIIDGRIDYSHRTYISWEKYEESPEIKIFNGDILFVKTGSTIGKAAIVKNIPEPMTLNPQVVVLKNILCNREFLAYAMNSEHYKYQVQGYRFGGSTPAMTQESLGQTIVAFPQNYSEQHAIARFLDYKTAQIDALIAKKEALLTKLAAKRTALISHAVTKGLDPSVPMKDSGIEWLREIPAHWDITKLGRIIRLQRGVDITKDQQVEGDVPVVSSGGIFSYHNISMASGPGVVIGRKGTLGTVHYVDTDYWAHDTTLWVKEFNGSFPKYIYYLLKAMKLEGFDTGSANPTLNRNLIHPEYVPLVSTEQQHRIASYLDCEMEKLDRLGEPIKKQINKLKEYRTALITNAVTGKIDVRNVPIPSSTPSEVPHAP